MCVLDLTCISCLTRDKDYFPQRLREELVKQSKEYWDSQARQCYRWGFESYNVFTVITLMLSIVTKMAIKAEGSLANYI